MEPQEAKIGTSKIKVLAKRKKIAWANMKKEKVTGTGGRASFLSAFSRHIFPRVSLSRLPQYLSRLQATKENTPLLLNNQAVNS